MYTRKNGVRRTTAAFALGAATLLVATPAVAAPGDPLPDWQQITGITDLGSEIGPSVSTFSVNAQTGAATSIADHPLVDGYWFTSIDVDNLGIGYVVSQTNGTEETGDYPVVATANANTGEFGALTRITLDPAVEEFQSVRYCNGADYTDGVIRTSCGLTTSGETSSVAVGTVTPDGVFTPEVLFDNEIGDIAMSPTGELYASDWDTLVLVDLATGTLSDPIEFSIEGTYIAGIDFDANGQLWAVGSSRLEEQAVLFTLDAATGETRVVGPLTDTGGSAEFWLDGITVWGAASAPVVPQPEPQPEPKKPVAPTPPKRVDTAA